MAYNSIEFIIAFLCFLTIYLIMPHVRLRQLVILVGSVAFYLMNGTPKMLAFLVGTSVIVYVTGFIIDRVYAGFEKEKEGLSPKESMALLPGYKKRAKKFVVAAVVLIAGVLIYTKVGRIAGLKTNDSISEMLTFRSLIVPIGISYYTFSSIGYLLDLYWRKAKFDKDYFVLLLTMTYFPHIVQGPISRYDKLMKQFKVLPGFQYERVCFGLQRMLWGFIKKMVISDRISIYTKTVFGSIDSYAGLPLWIAIVFSVLEIYTDFSGCMDIVIGAAQTMGVTLDENFRQPFFSRSAGEFWRRWHITLGAWFKDYICMPIAINPRMMKIGTKLRKRFGNRVSNNFTTLVPLAVTWVLTGLWHGTGIGYLFWGVYWGVLIFLEGALAPEFKKLASLLKIDVDSFGWKLIQHIRTFLFFAIGRIFSTSASLEAVGKIFKNTFSEARLWYLVSGDLEKIGLAFPDLCVVLVGIFVLWAADLIQSKNPVRETLAKQPLVFRWIVYYSAVIILIVFGMYGSGYNASAFIYGGF